MRLKNALKFFGLGLVISGIYVLGKESGRMDIAIACLAIVGILTVFELITLTQLRRGNNGRRKRETQRRARWQQQLHNRVAEM